MSVVIGVIHVNFMKNIIITNILKIYLFYIYIMTINNIFIINNI